MARKHEKERNEAIKKMIIDAALQICIEDGYEEVTVRRIGEKIGYSTGVIYYHFKDKQDILDCLDMRLDEETFNNISSIMSPDKTIKENLSILFDYTCDLAYNNTEAYKRIFVSSRVEKNSYTRSMWQKFLEECLRAAAARGEIKGDNVEEKTKCLLAYITGYNILFFEAGKTDEMSAMANKDIAVNVIANGITNA